MRKLSIFSTVILLFAAVFAPAGLIDFESLHPGFETSGILIPDGYMGLNWSDFFKGMTSGYLPGTGYENGTTGTMTAYTSYHEEVSMSSTGGTAFDFIGADITAGRLDNISVTVEGSRLGTVIYSESISTSTDGPYSFVFNFLNVDTVAFKPPQGNNDYHIAIDNIEIVPEPATLSLLALGGLTLMRKRK